MSASCLRRIFLVSLLCTTCIPLLLSQNIEAWIDTSYSMPDVQVYLHTDREFYFQGDTVWFKSYMVDRYSKHLTEEFDNMYVDLTGTEGTALTTVKVISQKGQADGYLPLPREIPPGNYLIRAYSAYLGKSGGAAIYAKPLAILKVINSTEIPVAEKEKRKKPPDISFLPEGGSLLEGCANIVAVKAVGQNGKGIGVKGIILDETGDSVSAFETGYRGMGICYLYPSPGKTYHARLEGYPGFSKEVGPVIRDGIKLHLNRHDKVETSVSILSNTTGFTGQKFYLAGLCLGKVQFYKEFILNETSRLFRIGNDVFPGGINRLVLLNSQLEPVSERVFFSDNFTVNHLTLNTGPDSHATRSEINLVIGDEKGTPYDTVSYLSVAVVDENSTGSDGPSSSVLSGLLIEPELRGNIENPADYFTEDSIPPAGKLEMLMLTHGWCRYLPEETQSDTGRLSFLPVIGFPLKGRVERLLGQKPVVNGNVSVMVYNRNETRFLGGKTDINGCFDFGRMIIYDSATVFVQARNEKGKTFTEVYLDPLFIEPPALSASQRESLAGYNAIPLELYRRRYFNELSLKEFYPERNTILLGEVEIKRQKKEADDGHFRIYGQADNSLKITDRDISYPDALTYLSGRVAGLMVTANGVSIRGMGTPLFLIDGMPFEGEDGMEMVRSIPMSDIDVVEVLKDISNLAVFGARGANGVIAVYTKRGSFESSAEDLTGIIRQKIIGYEPHKEFYTPKYLAQDSTLSVPDHRTTLYWNPSVTTREGVASLSFYSCDDLTHYRIVVEGITGDGRICTGTGRFTVDRFRRK